MRNLITLVESIQPFQLHPALDPKKYQITDSLADVERWRVYVYDGNSMGDGDAKPGTMGEVGYTMISKTSNHIIPIARSDEHHMGFDTLHGLARKNPGIVVRDFIPIFYGGNYINSMDEVPDYLNVIAKWLAYGGKNGVLEGARMTPRTAISMRDFVESGGKITVEPGQLAPIGKAILASYKEAATALRMARDNPEKKSAVNAAFMASLNVIKTFSSLGFLIMGDFKMEDVRNAVPRIKELKAAGDVQGLEEFMFGFHSLKNTMHNNLRALQKKRDSGQPDYFYGDKAAAIWGDIPLAIDALGRF
jgi:hypothetical protein